MQFMEEREVFFKVGCKVGRKAKGTGQTKSVEYQLCRDSLGTICLCMLAEEADSVVQYFSPSTQITISKQAITCI
jgi:hypothetical protein